MIHTVKSHDINGIGFRAKDDCFNGIGEVETELCDIREKGKRDALAQSEEPRSRPLHWKSSQVHHWTRETGRCGSYSTSQG